MIINLTELYSRMRLLLLLVALQMKTKLVFSELRSRKNVIFTKVNYNTFVSPLARFGHMFALIWVSRTTK